MKRIVSIIITIWLTPKISDKRKLHNSIHNISLSLGQYPFILQKTM